MILGLSLMADDDEFGALFGAPGAPAPQPLTLPLPKPSGPLVKGEKDAEEEAEVYMQLFGSAPGMQLLSRFAGVKPIMPLAVLPHVPPAPRPSLAPSSASGVRHSGSAAQPPSPGAAGGGRGALVIRLEAGAPDSGAGAVLPVPPPAPSLPQPAPSEDADFDVADLEVDTVILAQQQVATGGGAAAATGGQPTAAAAGPGTGRPGLPGSGQQGQGLGAVSAAPGQGGAADAAGSKLRLPEVAGAAPGQPGANPAGPRPPPGAPPAAPGSAPVPGPRPQFGPGPPGGRPFLPRQPQPVYGLNFRYNIEEAAWPTEARLDQAIKLPKQTRVTPEEYRAFLSLGHGEIYELDLDRVLPHEASWRNPSANPADYFNYDMNETAWRQYCARVRTYRDTFTLRNKITVMDPAGMAAAAAAAAAAGSGRGAGVGAVPVVDAIDPMLPAEVIAALRNMARNRKRWEEDSAPPPEGDMPEGVAGEDSDAEALGSGWDGNEGGYGLLAPLKGGREHHRRRAVPRLDADVIITLVEADEGDADEGPDGAAAAAAGSDQTPAAGAEVGEPVGKSGELGAAEATSASDVQEAEAEGVKEEPGSGEGPPAAAGAGAGQEAVERPADTASATAAATAAVTARAGESVQEQQELQQRRQLRNHAPVNSDYDTVPLYPTELAAQHMPGPPPKRSRTPPPVDGTRAHGRWPDGGLGAGPQVWEAEEGGGVAGRWEREQKDRERERIRRDRRAGPPLELMPPAPHGQQPTPMPRIGPPLAGPPLGLPPGMPMDMMGFDSGDFYLDGGGGDVDGEEDSDGGAPMLERKQSSDAGGGSGTAAGGGPAAANGAGQEYGMMGSGAVAATLPDVIKPEALVMPPIGPSISSEALDEAGTFARIVAGAFDLRNLDGPDTGGPQVTSLGIPQDAEPYIEQKTWNATDEAAAFGDFGGGGDYYMDDGYGNEDEDATEAPGQVQEQSHAAPAAGGSDQGPRHEGGHSDRNGSAHLGSAADYDDAGKEPAAPAGLGRDAAVAAVTLEVGGSRGGGMDDEYGGAGAPGGGVDTFFSDGNAGAAAGGGALSVMDLLNPLAAIGGMGAMAAMGALGPIGHMGALGPMHGLGMPSLLSGGMPPLVPGGMPLGMGMAPGAAAAEVAAISTEARPHGTLVPSGGHRTAREGGGRTDRAFLGRRSRSRSRSRRSRSRSRDRSSRRERVRSRSRDRDRREKDRGSPGRDRDRDRDRDRGSIKDRRRSRSRDRDRRDRDRRDRR
ncbi:hypothetical protein Vretimale_19588 [Volvox reticuliferus]|uniref:Pre-mRNA polyadenylation factor Fip1 domain-containing protein n=1 Tax=Volvox reticuliferus TaxID=1737510 RepID=A0A8J4GZG3_9CHLO|nr:hypothetical protein Vretifemale_20662 [Volvox reticuliferus]GIM17048.1 hypothetical protein Vretimale_19588 [Volvox reticuliferus]